MTLLELRIEGFGRLRNLTLQFSPSLNVICGPNEAGKSTLVECLVRLLFGYPEMQFKKVLERFQPWFDGVRYQATLAYRLDEGLELETTREFGRPDVRTKTCERARRVEIREYTGSRAVSPGQGYLKLSRPAFEAAAVIRATEFAQDEEADPSAQLAERLASLVGAAGDAGAADAVDRLNAFISELGGAPHAPKTMITKARAAVERAARDLADYDAHRADAADAIARRTLLQGRSAELEETKRRLAIARTAERLRVVRNRIARGEAEKSAVEEARLRYRALQAAPGAAAGERTQAVEDGVVAWKTARESESAARQRLADAVQRRDETQRAFSESLRSLGQATARVRELEQRAAALPDRSGKVEIREEDLRRLETLSDRVDRLEADAGTQATIAGISRQRNRPAPVAALASAVAAAIALAGGFVAHLPGLEYAGSALFAVALIVIAAWVFGGRRKLAGDTELERGAESAEALHAQALRELEVACRAFGCRDFAEVREAYNLQLRAAQLQAELAIARQAAEQCEVERAFRAEQLDGFAKLDRDVESAAAARDQRERALASMLDDFGVPGGDIDARVVTWRDSGRSGERAAQAGAEMHRAETRLAVALEGATLEGLRAEEMALAAALASADDGRLDTTDADARAELERLEGLLTDARIDLGRAEAEIETVMRDHRGGRAELEEAHARKLDEEKRLTEVRAAATLAVETIERLQDEVHRDFAPVLNDALSAAAANVTAGRYSQAFVDPASLRVKVVAPEIGRDVELELLSSGTREQLYLSLRAAVAQSLGSGERVPLILDDALAHSDDGRLAAAISHLARMGAEGQQILLFSQRGDLASIAERLGVPVLELSGP